MMEFKVWRTRIQESIEKVANEEYQKSTWLGKSDKVSSPEELYCTLFEDFLFEDFLESEQNDLPSEGIIKGRELSNKMSVFFDESVGFHDPQKVLKSAEWKEVRQIAESFLNYLKKQA